jgi:hypothetical protein
MRASNLKRESFSAVDHCHTLAVSAPKCATGWCYSNKTSTYSFVVDFVVVDLNHVFNCVLTVESNKAKASVPVCLPVKHQHCFFDLNYSFKFPI